MCFSFENEVLFSKKVSRYEDDCILKTIPMQDAATTLETFSWCMVSGQRNGNKFE